MSERLATPQPCRLASHFPLFSFPALAFSPSHFLSFPFFAAVERLTIAVRFIFCSIARSRIDVLWFYPRYCIPSSELTRGPFVHRTISNLIRCVVPNVVQLYLVAPLASLKDYSKGIAMSSIKSDLSGSNVPQTRG